MVYNLNKKATSASEETNILFDYVVNEDTIAIMPGLHTDYDVVVLERDQQLFVRKPALHIIQESCLEYGVSYDGLKKAVKYHTSFRQKLPIPVSIAKDVYMFPTHATTNHLCGWLSLRHITQIFPTHKPTRNSTSTWVRLADGKKLTIQQSYHTMTEQLSRAVYYRTLMIQKHA